MFKPLGDEDDKSLTYVAHDSADMISTIRGWKKAGMNLKGACMLQDFIPGIEMGVSAWMGRDGFLAPRNENAEHKKFMSNDYGPATGEQGTVMWYTQDSKLSRDVLDPMEKALLEIGHRGDVDINCIIDEKGKAWPLEFTSRLGWPAFYIMCAQHHEPVQWMRDALDGKDTLQVSYEAFVGAVVSIPPFPRKNPTREEVYGHPIHGLGPDNWRNVHLVSAEVGKGIEMENGHPVEKGIFTTTGEYVLVVTEHGPTIKKAAKDLYDVVDTIRIKNMQVRDDIGEKFAKKVPELHEFGFATGVRP